MYVCLCKGITDQSIRDAVCEGAESFRAVKKCLGASTECGQCSTHVRAIIKDTLESPDANNAQASMFYVA